MSLGFPQYSAPPVDVKTGQWNRDWLLFLQGLWSRTGAITGLTTDGVPEGTTNLYYTTTRARSAISVSGSLSYNSTTGVITYNTPTSYAWSSITGTPVTAGGYGITSIDGVPIGATTPSTGAFTSLNGGPLSGLRNVFINPEMGIDQRNNGAAQTITAGAALAYTVDCWYAYCTGANVTGQRVAGSGSSQYRYQFTGATSVTGIGFGQRIEAANTYRLAGTTATLAVDLANSLLTAVTWTAYYANSTDSFGTLASPTRTQIATGTFTVSSTVTRYFSQIAIPAAATTGIEVVFSVGSQTSGTWTIGRAALLPSGVNEIYSEPRPVGMELALCQRYYEAGSQCVFSGSVTSGASYFAVAPFKVTKRAVPTMTFTDLATNGNFPAGAPSLNSVDTSQAMATKTASGTGPAYFQFSWTASASL